MRFSLPQATFRDLLAGVKPFASPRGPLPILHNFLLEVADGRLSVYATDYQMSCLASLPVDDSMPGALTLEAKQLLDVVSRLDGEVQVSVSKHTATLKAGRTKVNLRGMPASEFPPLAPRADEAGVELDAALFRLAIAKTAYAAKGTEDGVLSGLWLSFDGGRMELAAMDGSRLAYWNSAVDTAVTQRCVVPRRAIVEVGRMLKGATGKIGIHRMESDGLLGFEIDGNYLTTRVLDAEYPVHFKRVLPGRATAVAHPSMDRPALLAALERVGALANELEANTIRLTFEGNELRIEASQDSSDILDIVATDGIAEPFEIFVKAPLMVDGVKAVDGDTITLLLMGLASPIGLASERDDDPLTTVVMPCSKPVAKAPAAV